MKTKLYRSKLITILPIVMLVASLTACNQQTPDIMRERWHYEDSIYNARHKALTDSLTKLYLHYSKTDSILALYHQNKTKRNEEINVIIKSDVGYLYEFWANRFGENSN